MIAVAGYSLVALWVLIIGAAVAERYAISSGYVAIGAFLLGVTFFYAVLDAAPEEDRL
jgi:hypothetical protein